MPTQRLIGRNENFHGETPKVNIYEVMLKIQDQIEQKVHETDNDLVIAFL